jgi:putative endonuclease
MTKGYMYILLCADGSYYTGSTKDLVIRLAQHQSGEGANHTKKHLPVKLVYYEEFQRIDEAFYREKQIQGWSRKKKEALIENRPEDLPMLSKNYTQYGASTSSATEKCENVVSTSSTSSTSSDASENYSVPELQPVPDLQPVPELVEGTTNMRNLEGVRYE